MIRLATIADIPPIQQIARQFSQGLGFVRRGSLERAISKNELYVADVGGGPIGFVNWHARLDGWSTIYEIGVHRDHHGQGIGRALLYAVPAPITLKCTTDNAQANKFYAGAGMRLEGVETGRKRNLNIWRMRVLNILNRGNGPDVPEIARLSGCAYGSAEQHTIYDWPYMIDVNFKKPNWAKYLTIIEKWNPVQALVVDYADPARKDEMLQHIADLKAAGVLRVVVCSKFHGAVKDIPADCIVGISLRTDGNLGDGENIYAGFMISPSECYGRKCHLLGGSPQLQKETMTKLHGADARVVSADGNAHFGSAHMSSVYQDGRWTRRDGVKVAAYDAQLIGSRNIQRELNAAANDRQPPLFAV